MLYAHTKPTGNSGIAKEDEWQTLDQHLRGTANIASKYAKQFGAADLAYNAGMLHDVGKASDDFQKRLHGCSRPVDHKSAGATEAYRRYGPFLGKIIAYCIYGHHNGLPNDISTDLNKGLSEVLNTKDRIEYMVETKPIDPAMLPKPSAQTKQQQAMYLSMLTRLLHSCLVDADYLDTEAFIEPVKYDSRVMSHLSIDQLQPLHEKHLENILRLSSGSPINKIRRDVLNACLAAGQMPKGMFSLTVPTGGGKTLSSLAFAFQHQKTHKEIQRIIYTIPFTSIIEQNAGVFKSIFGEEAVLEHHSNISVSDDENDINRLACENWDSPLIVTTNVQLFESLFSSTPSKARKLHSLVNSIIILDEAQMLPDYHLLPCLSALQTLVANFGATVVFCTATQPAIKPEWLDNTKPYEIIPDPALLYASLKRVNVKNLGAVTDEELSERFSGHSQVLCIVNTRKHARKLFDLISETEGAYHLSAFMCAEHRSKIISEIKARLKNGEKCRVISTQLIEAGVDIDFPVVYRASAGIDSIAQAAGRCNREGKLKSGEVFVFRPESRIPAGWLARMAQIGEEVLSEYEDPLLPEAIEQFFHLRFGLGADLDECGILNSLVRGAKELSFQYKEISEGFKIIKSSTVSIIIPYDRQAREIIDAALHSEYPGGYLRKLQKYSVSVYRYDIERLEGMITELCEGYFVLAVNELEYESLYSCSCGLTLNYEREVLIC